jgi:hypothetical protein
MATLSTAARNAAVDAITAEIDNGTAVARGILRLYGPSFTPTINSVFLGTGVPTFGAASGGSATAFRSSEKFTSVGTATLTGYAIFNRDNVATIFSVNGVGDVGSGADIEMVARDCIAGQSLVYGTTTITMPASS